jgi:hypothetical protein
MLTVRPLTSAGDASNSAPKPTPSCLIATFCSCRERSSLDLRGTAASLRLPSTASFVFVNETLDLRLETPPASAGPPPPPAVTLVPFSASVDSAARTPKPEAPFSITTLPPLIVREPDFVTSSPLTPEPDWFSSSMSSSVNPAPVSAIGDGRARPARKRDEAHVRERHRACARGDGHTLRFALDHHPRAVAVDRQARIARFGERDRFDVRFPTSPGSTSIVLGAGDFSALAIASAIVRQASLPGCVQAPGSPRWFTKNVVAEAALAARAPISVTAAQQ